MSRYRAKKVIVTSDGGTFVDFSQKLLEVEAVKEKAAITEDTLRQLLSQSLICIQ